MPDFQAVFKDYLHSLMTFDGTVWGVSIAVFLGCIHAFNGAQTT